MARSRASFTVPSRLLDGPNTVSAIGNGRRVSAIATLNGVLPIASQFYFAGAMNTATEHSSVHILEHQCESASVRLTFFFGSGATDTKLITVAAHAEKVVPVASLEPFTGAVRPRPAGQSPHLGANLDRARRPGRRHLAREHRPGPDMVHGRGLYRPDLPGERLDPQRRLQCTGARAVATAAVRWPRRPGPLR